MDVHSLLFLGTGPGTPVPERFCSSCVVRGERSLVLVDAGEPCSQRLVAAGVGVADLDAVLITHGHSDHTGGFPMLVQSAWLSPRSRSLPVYLPRELIKPLLAWLDAVYLPPSLLGFELEFRPWDASAVVEVAASVRVGLFPTTHLLGLHRRIDPSARGRFEVYGLDLDVDGRRVVFSSDLGSPSDLEPVLGRPCHALVCELSHFQPDDLFAVLRGREIGKLLFNHLAPELNGRDEELLRRARSELPQIGEIRIVNDGDMVVF